MKFFNIFNSKDAKDNWHLAAQVKAATKMTMDDTSRERMRAHLSEYAKMRPVRGQSAPREHSSLWRIPAYLGRHSMSALTAVLIVMVSTGTVAAAETSLPGDLLYPIKVHVTEEVQATLAITPKAKADWAVARAERRLEEAATLALAGKLNDETRAEIDANLDEHVKSAGDIRTQLAKEHDEQGASEVETNIGAIAIARENILEGGRRGPGAAAAAATMSASVRPENAASLRVETAKESDRSETEARGNRTAAKVRIEASKKFLKQSDRLGSTTREQAQERLDVATEAFTSGEKDSARGNRGEASSNFNSALQAATEIQTLISVSDNARNDSNEQNSRDGNGDGGKSGDGEKRSSSGVDGGGVNLGL